MPLQRGLLAIAGRIRRHSRRRNRIEGSRQALLKFAVTGLATVCLIGLGGLWAGRRAGEMHAISEVSALAGSVANTAVAPNLTDELLAGDPAAIAAFDRLVKQRVVTGSTVRVKLWTEDGTIIYSDEPRLIGAHYELSDHKVETFEQSLASAEVSDLAGPENIYERDRGQLLEVYQPVEAQNGSIVLYESYYAFDAVNVASRQIWAAFVPIILGSLLVMEAGQILLAAQMARRLRSSQRERERLLAGAVEASDRERHRIAADLHDGVVQDLVSVSFGLNAAVSEMRDRGVPEVGNGLKAAATGTRRSIQALRSLIVDIYPPDLDRDGLVPAIEHLVAPLANSGIEVELETPERLSLNPESVGLVYRIIQEAVRNVERHARAQHLRIALTETGSGVRVEVVDDGCGFDPSTHSQNGHFGLRLMTDLANQHDAKAYVASSPGEGTTVTLEVS